MTHAIDMQIQKCLKAPRTALRPQDSDIPGAKVTGHGPGSWVLLRPDHGDLRGASGGEFRRGESMEELYKASKGIGLGSFTRYTRLL